MVNVNDYEKECECIYKEERYSVRDNGAVLRHHIEGKRARPTDNNWTFGKLNRKTGYLEIASVRVHRIVATAFHGEPPAKEYVVDHVDTNKQNNRPENLRWVTRLENILLNPITVRRIELACGSVEAFLADPSRFRDMFTEPNYQWMRTVSKEESQACLERLTIWAKSDNHPSGGSLGEWLFSRETVQSSPAAQPNYIVSKTPNAAQCILTHYDKPNEYPCTPQSFESNPLMAYSENLNKGAVFFRNHNGEYVVEKSGFSKDRHNIYVMTRAAYVWSEQENGEHIPVPITGDQEEDFYKDLPHSLTAITYEDGLFVHTKQELGFHPTEELEIIFANYTQEL